MIVCAYCWREKGPDGYPLGPRLNEQESRDRDSHGVCKLCAAEMRADIMCDRALRRLIGPHYAPGVRIEAVN